MGSSWAIYGQFIGKRIQCIILLKCRSFSSSPVRPLFLSSRLGSRAMGSERSWRKPSYQAAQGRGVNLTSSLSHSCELNTQKLMVEFVYSLSGNLETKLFNTCRLDLIRHRLKKPLLDCYRTFAIKLSDLRFFSFCNSSLTPV